MKGTSCHLPRGVLLSFHAQYASREFFSQIGWWVYHLFLCNVHVYLTGDYIPSLLGSQNIRRSSAVNKDSTSLAFLGGVSEIHTRVLACHLPLQGIQGHGTGTQEPKWLMKKRLCRVVLHRLTKEVGQSACQSKGHMHQLLCLLQGRDALSPGAVSLPLSVLT